MSDLPTSTPGDKLKKALIALSEAVDKHPYKDRAILLEDIVIRFDLSPKECQFLHDNFTKINNGNE